MIFNETPLKGAFLIHLERKIDDRGFFARSWCELEFKQHGIETKWTQCNISFNSAIGTLRGMHFQAPPHEEAKLIRCTMGVIYDVIVDLRPNSSTYLKWFSTDLSSMSRNMLYVPKGFAHGFLSLTDRSEVFYMMSEGYASGCARGIRWNDPALKIKWPKDVKVMSDQDMNWPDFKV
jgi:dTDP-4-dehydrorhamnose 3,5-epimerase